MNTEAGAEIRRRRLALGLSVNRFAKISGVYRDTLYALERGEKNPRETTILAVEKALEDLEREKGIKPPAPVPPATPLPVIRVTVQGAYSGDTDIVVEATPDQLDTLTRLVDRVMQNLRT